jgi:hypothetical protein
MDFLRFCQYFGTDISLAKDAPFDALQEYVKLILGSLKRSA